MTAAPTSLHTTRIGDTGAPVVFLHGLFGQGKNFNQIAKALQPDFSSLLVDLPNHGRSPWTENVDYGDTADAVAAELRSGFAADRPVHLVGHSMGGKVAMVLALRHPELVDRLVVVDIAPVASDGAGEFAHLLDSLAGVDLTSVHRRSDADEQLLEPISDARVRGFLLQNLRSGPNGFRWQANLDLLRRDLPTIMGFPRLDTSFDHPTLWLAGERSPYVQAEHEPEMRRLFPKAVQVTIKGAGHWIHADHPEAFVSAVRTFLAAASTAG